MILGHNAVILILALCVILHTTTGKSIVVRRSADGSDSDNDNDTDDGIDNENDTGVDGDDDDDDDDNGIMDTTKDVLGGLVGGLEDKAMKNISDEIDENLEKVPEEDKNETIETGEHEVEHTDASGGDKTQSADFNIPPDEITIQNGGAGYSSANESSGVGNNNKSPFKVNYSGMSATGIHGVDDKNKSPGKMKPPGKEGGEAAGESHQQVPDNKPGKVKGTQDGKNKATETQSSGGGTVPKGQGSPKGDQYNRPPGNVPSVPD
ncbi:uncharacterized protein LOC110441685 [Mizuhopecten yessoensis]|uniref:uncharacterized protein LOC110441685 n=1 Tax=Mizuhopecten yessoensis TaxID=6573 RepID=UPI000B45F622|nr:uncharacterized protein LOC110441685 [Mizuhopecten yessoensis]